MNEQKIFFLKSVKKQLDSFGPGMCLAKWSQTTIHLGTGHTHSCHHPGTHKIPLDEIKLDPSALHNTSYKKEKRKEMMTGIRPEECQYCWNVEDNIKKEETVFSDRVYKSSEQWSRIMFNDILRSKWDKNISPSYLEVSFNSTCNFKCSYCSPEISSKWMEEIVEYGPYPTSRHYNSLDRIKNDFDKMPILEKDYNPYVEAFWQWWPEVYPKLHTFRITGGEPLLTKHTFKVLDWIIDNPNKNLELAINSNLVIPDTLFDKFIEKVKIIISKKAVRIVSLFTSCEAYGKQAEYIRFGLDYNKWLKNCYKFSKECPEAKFALMSTYNALSVFSYTKFLQDMLELKKYRQSLDCVYHSFTVDIPYLSNPIFLNIKVLTEEFLPYFQDHLNFMESNLLDFSFSKNPVGFQDYELSKMKRVVNLFQGSLNSTDKFLISHRKDFVKFVDEHDRRRGTNFLETFPEMENFYLSCKALIN
jgi:organic radical activating enzyme